MAMNDTIKNRTSIVFHQIGVSSQQVAEQDFAINKKGVAMQCIAQSSELIAPNLSDFLCNIFVFTNDMIIIF